MPSQNIPIELPDGGERPVDVVCLGHALVDRLAEVDEDVVERAGLVHGAMTLVDGDEAAVIERAHGGWAEDAGGSAANTAVGLASLGGSAVFVGSIGDDEAGQRYVTGLEAHGVRCVARIARGGSPTGVCHVLVTPEGDRTMATSLAAAGELSAAAVDEAGIASSLLIYLEGYLLDAPAAAEALERAVEVAKSAGTLVSLSLSDPFVVERHRGRILELIASGTIDLLFGNAEEALSLTGAAVLEDSFGLLERPGMVTVITRGARGSMALGPTGAERHAADEVEAVVDTTGAGDQFAAGVLYALARGKSLHTALGIGSRAASEVISHLGARPLVSLAELTGEIVSPS